VSKRKQYTVATTVSEKEYEWIQNRVNGGEALNQSDLLRIALRKYMREELEKEDYMVVERRVLLREND
jgi:Arc/MetJ-type ribon-helix-helix transcriptional regulator